MALSPILTYTNESPDGDNYTGTITDGTVFGTGGNPARADVAVYFTGEKIKSDTTVDYDVTIDSYLPESATTFTFDITKDGWYQFRYLIVPDYSGVTTYAIYDAVYYNSVVYRAKLNSFSGQLPTNTSYWDVIATPTDLIDNDGTATESNNITFDIYDIIIYPFAKTEYGTKAYEAALECCSTCERSEEVKNYEYFGVLVDGMKSANTRERWAAGEKIARKSDELAG